MTHVTGILFAVRAAFVLVDAARRRRHKRLARITIDYALPDIEQTSPAIQAYVIYNSDDNWDPDKPQGSILTQYEDLFFDAPGGQGKLFLPGVSPERKARLVSALLEIPDDDDALDDIPWMCEHHALRSWVDLGDTDRKDRMRLIFGLSNVALDFLGTQTHRLGLRPRAETIVAGLTGSVSGKMARMLTDDDLGSAGQTLGRHVLETMLESSLDLAESHAHLFSDEKPIQALVSAALGPLRDVNEANRGEQFFTGARLQRLRETLRGPVAVSVLQSLHDNRHDLFDGDYPEKESAAGIVTDAFLEGLISDVQDGGNIRDVFTPDFVARVYPKVLTAVGEAPEAFITGKGQAAALGRDYLSGLAQAVNLQAGAGGPQLAQSVIELGVNVARKHAGIYLEQTTEALLAEAAEKSGLEGRSPWSLVQIRIASHIANEIIGNAGGGRFGLDSLRDVTQRSFLMELVGILADEVAQTPSLLVGGTASPELTNIARGVAAFVASEHADLLTRQDWRRVTAKAASLAMANPGRLFDLETDSPETFLAVSLVQRILSAAHETTSAVAAGQHPPRRPDQLLFGQTLVSAIEETLDLAVAHTRQLANPRSQDSLIDFMTRLNAMAGNPERGLSAGEWLTAFRWFGADAIASGGLDMSDAELVKIVETLGRGEGARQPASVSAANGLPPGAAINGATAPEDIEEVYYRPAIVEDALG
ncbi:MAG: hypothetical protein AAFY34_05445 [Pseudomonadota bacterium]